MSVEGRMWHGDACWDHAMVCDPSCQVVCPGEGLSLSRLGGGFGGGHRLVTCVIAVVRLGLGFGVNEELLLEDEEQDGTRQDDQAEDQEHKPRRLVEADRALREFYLDVLGAKLHQEEARDQTGDQLRQGERHPREAHEGSFLALGRDRSHVVRELWAPDELAGREEENLDVDHDHVGAGRVDTEQVGCVTVRFLEPGHPIYPANRPIFLLLSGTMFFH